MPPKEPTSSWAPKGPKGIEKCKLPCPEAKFRIKCALIGLLVFFLLLLFYSPPCILWWWGALGLFVCIYSMFWWLQRRVLATSSQRCQVFSKAPHPQTLFSLVRGGGIPVLHKRLCEQLQRTGSLKRRLRCAFVIGHGGGGHLTAMNAIKALMAEAGCDWEFIEVDIAGKLETSDHAPLDFVFKTTGEELYNWCLDVSGIRGMLCAKILYILSNIAFFFLHRGDHGFKICQQEWLKAQPDIVICVITMVNRIASEGLDWAGMSDVPFVTMITDFAHSFDHPWIQSRRQHVICGSSTLQEQARDLLFPAHCVLPTSGMPIGHKFYDAFITHLDRRKELLQQGLDPALKTVLVFYGGLGTPRMLKIAEALKKCRTKVNVIFLCGYNDDLHAQFQSLIKAKKLGYNASSFAFTNNVPMFMQLADVVVCKPGPGVVTEATCIGVPVVVEFNESTLAQEVAVAMWVQREGVGMLWTNYDEAPMCVDRICDQMHTTGVRRIRHLPPNTAIFEVCTSLAKVAADSILQGRERRQSQE